MACLRERIAALEAALAAETRRADGLARREARPAEASPRAVALPHDCEAPPQEIVHRGEGALLDTLFATAPVGLAFLDAELRFVRVNARLAEINGPSPAEHLGRTLEEIIPELGPQLAPYYRHVLTTGEAISNLEVRGSTAADPERPRVWLVSYYPVPGDGGQVAGVGVVVLDVTERTQAEAALQRQAETLREQAAAMDLAHIIARDAESRILAWNQGAETLYGWSRAEALGQISHELLQTRFPVSRAAYEAQLSGEGVWEGELAHRRKDGGELVVASHQVLYRDPDGRPRRIVEVNNDITSLKRAEEGLRRMAERLRTLNAIDRAILAAQTPEQIARVVVARLQQLVPCDRIAVVAYDHEQSRIEQLAISDVRPERVVYGQFLPIEPRDLLAPFPLAEPWYVPDTDQVDVLSPRAIPHRALGFRSLLHFPLIAEGQLLGLLRLAMERPDAFSEGDIAVVREVADQLAIALRSAHLRAQVEQERALLARRVAERTADLSAANAELAQAARVKDEFLSNMSHELRTPLNAILGRAELLREQVYGPLTSQQDASVQSIAEAGQHLLTLINDILDLSKVEAGKLALELVPLEVETIGRAAVRMVAQMALGKQITLTTMYDSRVETVAADERRLKQILVNLLSNAVKFTHEGGKVGLEVRADPDQQVVTFTVWDTGIGIAPEDQARLFQPFVQIDSSLSRQHEGTGLGLALVLRLTELHGGSVALESSPGQGSRFSVSLPWSGDVAPPASAPAPLEEAALGAPLAIHRALVIEDSHTAMEQISRYLGDLGSRVEVHDRAGGALERARELQPDLIVLDILLPDQPGWEVLRQLKADPLTAAIPVLVVSVVDDPARAKALGAAGFVLKPLTRDRFLQALSQLRATAEPAEPAAPPLALGTAEPPDFRLALLVVGHTSAARPLVLLVDDNEANLEVLADYLPAAGYDVVVARNGAEAVARAEELSPAVIVMDIQMPVMDGLEATRRIRPAGLRDTPIIALTALAMPGDRERCLAAGATEYLSKPVSPRTLLARIRAQIQGQRAN